MSRLPDGKRYVVTIARPTWMRTASKLLEVSQFFSSEDSRIPLSIRAVAAGGGSRGEEQMKMISLIAASAITMAAAMPVQAAMTLTGTGPGTIATVNTGSTSTFTYGVDGMSATWTLSGIADETGTRTFTYDSRGFYSYYNVRAAASAFSGLVSTTLYDAGPVDCCSSPSTSFNYAGSVTLALVAGQEYGFRISGSNFDVANRLEGVFAVTDGIPAVPEPATWAMMLVGFGMIGATARYRRRATRVVYA